MAWIRVLFLGALQGVTEFLPVSSSGHLVLAQHFLGFTEDDSPRDLFFDGLLHLGTLIAVLLYFGQEIRAQMRFAFRKPTSEASAWPSTFTHFVHLGLLLFLATVPAVLMAMWKDESIKESFRQPRVVAANFLFLGAILIFTDWLGRKNPGTYVGAQTTWWQALAIGVAQACSAVFRGLSRSGMTIATSLVVGLERTWAVRFSFMMSTIASLGLGLLGIRKALQDPERATWLTTEFLLQTLAATLVSGIVGYLTIGPLIALVKRCQLWWFGVYVWFVGLAVIFFEPQIKSMLTGFTFSAVAG